MQKLVGKGMQENQEPGDNCQESQKCRAVYVTHEIFQKLKAGESLLLEYINIIGNPSGESDAQIKRLTQFKIDALKWAEAQ